MPELSLAELALRIALAAGLGAAIGLERELREREAGLRTHLLVSLGAALFTIVSAYAWSDWSFSNRSGIVFDPTRIAAQIVTGVGFLGAGAIIRQGLTVRGLTTAATLWAVAAIGMAVGAGYYAAAVITTVVVIVSLWPLRILAYRLFTRVRPEERPLEIELPSGASAQPVLAAVEDLGAEVESFQLERSRDGLLVTLRRLPERHERGASAARRHRGRPGGALELVARLCSGNPHKLDELRSALPGWRLELLGVDGFPAEDGSTYYENARTKARFGREVGDPTAWMLGEDSGLEVDALGGRPGLHSARWAGDEDPIDRLLRELDGIEDCRGRYVCELVAISPEGEELRGTGRLEGRIAQARRGSEGFGYDPIFVPEGEERTVAELGDAWKAEHSHRARAAQALAQSVEASA